MSPRPRGFTLIELAVAIFITAVLFAIGYGAVNQAVNNREALEERQERLLAVQTTMRVLGQDIGQLALRPLTLSSAMAPVTANTARPSPPTP